MGLPSYMRSVSDRNFIMRRTPVFHVTTLRARIQMRSSVVSLSSKDSRGKATAISVDGRLSADSGQRESPYCLPSVLCRWQSSRQPRESSLKQGWWNFSRAGAHGSLKE
jgi:hypothetical protein